MLDAKRFLVFREALACENLGRFTGVRRRTNRMVCSLCGMDGVHDLKGARGVPGLREYLYEVKIISDFAAAHNLRNFRGKCEALHGHNWKVEVVLRGTELNESGVLLDFGEVKQVTRELLSGVDHLYLNDLPFFREHNPSSENIARYLFDQLAEKLNSKERWVYQVSAWESADACATVMIKE